MCFGNKGAKVRSKMFFFHNPLIDFPILIIKWINKKYPVQGIYFFTKNDVVILINKKLNQTTFFSISV